MQVGCFLAQVPGAYTQRVLALLELMLSTTALPEGTALEHADTGGAVGFLLPYLRQVLDTNQLLQHSWSKNIAPRKICFKIELFLFTTRWMINARDFIETILGIYALR